MYLVDTYGPLNGASALAANGLLRYGLSAVFPLFTVQSTFVTPRDSWEGQHANSCAVYNTLTIPWASSLLAFLSILMLPIPFVLFKYGPQIRKKSRYDTIKA